MNLVHLPLLKVFYPSDLMILSTLGIKPGN